jgi:capsular polysaccharide transport system permease protein
VNDQSENTASLSIITALSTQLAQLRTDYRQRQMLSPDSPIIQSLTARIASYESEIARRESDLAGDSHSLASKIGGLDALEMEKTIAQKQWETAEANRLLALQNERRQHLYLQTVVQPNIEDEPSYPRRWLYLLLTFVVAEMFFVIARTLREFAMEHAA